MVSLYQIPESDDPAERARIPQWLKRQSKERRRLAAWIATIMALFVFLSFIVGLGVFYDDENCGEILGSRMPWICSSTARGIVGLSGIALIMGSFMRYMVFVMRIYRFRDPLDSNQPKSVDPYDPETW
jgi:NADH:ubiquinone oxidoreductase subunit 4 (subunit M)